MPGNLLYAWMAERMGETFTLTGEGLLATVAYTIGVAPTAVAYAAAFVLLWDRPGPRRILSMFAPLGRMAVSCYLGQTLIGLSLFYGYGLNLMGRMGASWALPLAAVILGGQWLFASLWLARFHYGPVEWVWRMLTYGRAIPLRIRTIAASA